MNLVYDSSSSLGMNYVVNFVYCYADSPISGSFNPVLLRRCFVVGPRHTWMYPLRFILQQDEYETITRHNSLFIVRVHIISCYVLLGVSMVAEVGY